MWVEGKSGNFSCFHQGFRPVTASNHGQNVLTGTAGRVRTSAEDLDCCDGSFQSGLTGKNDQSFSEGTGTGDRCNQKNGFEQGKASELQTSNGASEFN